MKYRLELQLFAKSSSTTTQKQEGGSTESSSSSTVGGSSSHTEGGSTSESHSYGESHGTGGSQSSSVGQSWASGTVEENTANKREEANKDYAQSDAVNQTYDRLQELLNKQPSYQNKYEDKLNDLYEQIMNRDKFEYDFNADTMYQLYKDQYTDRGKKAMQDTMATAAALSGGYGSSYSQTAGQQTYQNYLQQLNDMISTLRNQAYSEYEREGQDLLNKYNVTADAYNRDYSQYRDEVADWQSDRNFNYGMYSDERNFDYNKYANDRNYWMQEYWNEKNSAQSNQQAAQENNWNDTYSKQDTFTNTKYWEDTNSNYWSNTNSTSSANSWSNAMSTSQSNAASAGSSAKKAYDDIVKAQQNDLKNKQVNWNELSSSQKQLLQQQNGDDVSKRESLIDQNSALLTMGGNAFDSLVKDLKQINSNQYLDLIQAAADKFNLTENDIEALIKFIGRKI